MIFSLASNTIGIELSLDLPINATSIPIGVEGRGGGSHKVVGPFDTKTFIWPTGFNSGCFQLHRCHKM